MTHGPGKYDDLCTQVLIRSGGDGCIVIVFNGVHGSGFSVQGPERLLAELPSLLECLAADIRADIKHKPLTS